MEAAFPPAFLTALVDTLLPGDATLPSGTAAGVGMGADNERDASTLQAIARHAGGADAFAAATLEQRTAILAATEAQNAAVFRMLLPPLLQDYYESNAVSAVLGWRGGAPQPRGHDVAPTDDETWRRLDRVRQRGALWRKVR